MNADTTSVGGAASGSKPVDAQDVEVRNKDISEEHLAAAIRLACEAVGCCRTELEVAQYIKNAFDISFGPKWHCVVGRHFASHVSYEPSHYVYLKVGREVILLFKSGGPVKA